MPPTDAKALSRTSIVEDGRPMCRLHTWEPPPRRWDQTGHAYDGCSSLCGHGRFTGLMRLYSLLDILLETERPDEVGSAGSSAWARAGSPGDNAVNGALFSNRQWLVQ